MALLEKEGQVASWDSKLISSDLGDLGGCIATSGYCINDDSMILWNASMLSNLCPFVFKNIYQAKLSGSYIIIDEIQGAFVIQSAYQNCPNFRNLMNTQQESSINAAHIAKSVNAKHQCRIMVDELFGHCMEDE
uniref:Uncharacterized protein n=1 Tax=Romanomermis culicivorax TaxID=13658 RepID=A0A915KNF9_ROMCU